MNQWEKFSEKIPSMIPVLLLFLIVYMPHQYYGLPFHTDSWISLDLAKHIIDKQEISFSSPFGGETVIYPRGSHTLIALLSIVSGLSLVDISIYLPSFLYAALGLAFYALAKIIFEEKEAALFTLALSPLAISNYTMLGPAYLVPLAVGSILVINYFYFLVSSKYRQRIFLLPALALFSTVALTHINTTLFAIVSSMLFLFFSLLWERKFLADVVIILFLILAIVGSAGIFIEIFGFEKVQELFWQYLVLEKEKPYQDYIALEGFIPAFLITVSLYYILLRFEKKALSFLVPIFVFLVLESIAYWFASGFFIRYRRIIYFLVLLTPLLAGFGAYNLVNSIMKLRFLRERYILRRVFAGFSFIFLISLAVWTNLDTNSEITMYLNQHEHEVFTVLGRISPDSMVFGHHLTSYSFPYYELQPLQLSPRHLGPKLRYESGLYRVYPNGDLSQFSKFFNWLDGNYGKGLFEWLDFQKKSDYYLYLPLSRNNKKFDRVLDSGQTVVLRWNHNVNSG
ncbi:hypothetical protein ACFLRC_01190 [Candidatus Altiarchaeota archaeon]